MKDPIERQAAIDALRDWYDGMIISSFRGIEKVIKALPSAQPDIIACGDCKHYIPHDKRCGYWNHGVKPLMWCSQAERR